jgi:glucokinase
MYLGIDIGGTKTLVATFDDQGKLAEKAKFSTDRDYPEFLEGLKKNIDSLSAKDFQYCGVGIPATVIDRSRGVGVSFGNLPWRDAPVQADIGRLCNCPVVVENDTKMAGLSEAILLKDKYKSVLYVTVSTGVGFALVVDRVIDTSVGDGGGRALMLEHEGKMMPWEDFASGRAIVERYGLKAKDITDKATWQEISHDLAQGLIQIIAITQPEVVVIGGGVGAYFEKYGKSLADELGKYKLPLIPMPALVGAQRPEEAVVYGCYELAKQEFNRAKAD